MGSRSSKGPADWIDDNGHKMFLNTNWKLQSKAIEQDID